jgi:hypothetical protein
LLFVCTAAREGLTAAPAIAEFPPSWLTQQG